MSKIELLQVAKVGRLVGLNGELKLHLETDFPEQFHKGAVFSTQTNSELTIEKYNKTKKTVIFKNYNSRDEAKNLVNMTLLKSKESSFESCNLAEDEFFWFDVIGAKIHENGKILGIVKEIERISINDYLLVEVDENLVKLKLPKQFYIPYIDRYIDRFDNEEKVVHTKDAYLLLENS